MQFIIMLVIDGSEQHGGGSIVRLASGFSVLSQIPIRITNIRAGRTTPGLKEQHVSSLRAIEKLCDAELLGNDIGSTEIELHPKPIKTSHVEISISTAGSVGLALQPILIAAASSEYPVRLSIRGGGTVGKWAPPTHFLENVTFAMLKKMGYKIDLYVNRHGFYPAGGARADVEIYPPEKIEPLYISEPGEVLYVNGISMASADLEYGKVVERQEHACTEILEKYFEDSGTCINIRKDYVNSDSPGSCLAAWIETDNTVLGSDMIGERGVRSDIIGKKVAEDLLRLHESGATLDEHAADQILPFLALTNRFLIKVPQLTGHIKASMWMAEKFLGKKFIVDKVGSTVIIKD